MKHKLLASFLTLCLICLSSGCTEKSTTSIGAAFSESHAEENPVSGQSLDALGYSFQIPENIGISDPNPIEHKNPIITAQTFNNDIWKKVNILGNYTFICLNVSYWGNASDEVELMYLQAFRNDEIQSDQTIFSVSNQSFQKADVSPYIVFQNNDITVYDWLPLIYSNGISDIIDAYQKELEGTEGAEYDFSWFSEIRSYLLSNFSSILVFHLANTCSLVA